MPSSQRLQSYQILTQTIKLLFLTNLSGQPPGYNQLPRSWTDSAIVACFRRSRSLNKTNRLQDFGQAVVSAKPALDATMEENELELIREKVKAQIRHSMKNLRNTIPAQAREERSKQACQQALSWLENIQSYQRIGLFASIHSEIDTTALFEALRRLNKVIALPRVTDTESSLVFHESKNLSELSDGPWNLPQPRPTEPVVQPTEIDCLFVPGLAFDNRGYRIGYGMGHYDRFIPSCRKDCIKVGLAFDFQLVAEIPHQVHDQPLNRIITDKQHIVVAMP